MTELLLALKETFHPHCPLADPKFPPLHQSFSPNFPLLMRYQAPTPRTPPTPVHMFFSTIFMRAVLKGCSYVVLGQLIGVNGDPRKGS